ncbi:MAG: hypothetical protein NVS2B4_02900 [Ramlibacter sp.]
MSAVGIAADGTVQVATQHGCVIVGLWCSPQGSTDVVAALQETPAAPVREIARAAVTMPVVRDRKLLPTIVQGIQAELRRSYRLSAVLEQAFNLALEMFVKNLQHLWIIADRPGLTCD